MTDFTRRTHVVRIYDTPPAAGQAPSGTYVDVEVLDAIAYRRENGEEAILNFAGGQINPYIVDDTGDGNDKAPDASVATRRSHMKRITSSDGQSFFDAEILDCIAFRDENGTEWIIDFPNPDGSVKEYNTTTGDGDETATRRVHNEQISSDLTNPTPTSYLTSVRTDAIAFRTVFGREMILKMPSSDDPNGSAPRASTFITTPQDYVPDNSADAPAPPPPNSDANVYAFMPPGGSFFTGDTPIDMGPLWWIRNVNGGSQKYLLLWGSNSTAQVQDGQLDGVTVFSFPDFPGVADITLVNGRVRPIPSSSNLIDLDTGLTITTKMLDGSPQPDAKKGPFTGFGIYQFVEDPFRPFIVSALYLQLTGLLAGPTPYRISITVSTGLPPLNSNSGGGVGLYAKDNIKAGGVTFNPAIQGDQSVGNPVVFIVTSNELPGPVTTTYLVDPVALTVTAL